MSQTLIIFESKYGLSEAIARDLGRILGPARVCRARDLADLEAADIAAAHEGTSTTAPGGCGAAARRARFVVIVTPVYRHEPDEHVIAFARVHREWLCARNVALVCVGLATSPGAVGAYLRPLTELLGDCVAWTGGLGGRVAMDWLDAGDRADIEQAPDLRAHRGLSALDAYSAEQVAEAGLAIKTVRDSFASPAPPEEVRRRIDDFLTAHNTCTLCTGAAGHVRATPIEYLYRDGELYLISEGGEKFAHLLVNPHVSVAVYDPYEGMDKLAGLQLLGRAEVVPEGADSYLRALGWRGMDTEAVAAMPFTLNLIRVHVERAELLWSGFADLGYDRRQVYVFPPPPDMHGA